MTRFKGVDNKNDIIIEDASLCGWIIKSFNISKSEFFRLLKSNAITINNVKTTINKESVGLIEDGRVIGDGYVGFILGIGKKRREAWCLDKNGKLVRWPEGEGIPFVQVRT